MAGTILVGVEGEGGGDSPDIRREHSPADGCLVEVRAGRGGRVIPLPSCWTKDGVRLKMAEIPTFSWSKIGDQVWVTSIRIDRRDPCLLRS